MLLLSVSFISCCWGFCSIPFGAMGRARRAILGDLLSLRTLWQRSGWAEAAEPHRYLYATGWRAGKHDFAAAEDTVEKGMATHSSILARRIPWTEGPGGLWSMGSQRAGHD